MAPAEINAIKELGGDVRELSGEVRDLNVMLREHIVRDEAAWEGSKTTHAEVFGVDGDPNKPGLKGQMRDVRRDVSDHSEQFDAIKETYKGGLSKAWMLVVAIISAAAGAILKHYLGGPG